MMQVTEPRKPLDDQGQGIEQPQDEYAVVVMMTNMFQPVLALSISQRLLAMRNSERVLTRFGDKLVNQ
jgi:hypothetical protein